MVGVHRLMVNPLLPSAGAPHLTGKRKQSLPSGTGGIRKLET